MVLSESLSLGGSPFHSVFFRDHANSSPYQSHVGLAVHWVAEDVALYGGLGFLDPEEDCITSAQTDLRGKPGVKLQS